MAGKIPHPIAACLPEMPANEYGVLRDDIQRFGQRLPITLVSGKVIDGRHRQRACLELGIEPRYEEYDGPMDDESLARFVGSANLIRRHMTIGERQIAAGKLRQYFAEAAKKRQKDALNRGNRTMGRKAKDDPERLPESFPTPSGDARDLAGEIFDVSGSKVDEAASVLDKAPDLVPKVEAGEISLAAAYREAKERDGEPPSTVTVEPPPQTAIQKWLGRKPAEASWFEVAKAAWANLSEDERRAFWQEVKL